VTVESQSCISFNSVDPFDETVARMPGRFTLVHSPSQQQKTLQVHPSAISVRVLLLFAPLQWDDLRTAYRVFIHLDRPLANGANWNLTAVGLNATWNSKPISRAVSLNVSALNTNIRLNQVGFLPRQPKRAWLGQYAGQGVDGRNRAINFSTSSGAPTFEVLSDTDGQKTVLTGNATQSGARQAFNLTGQQLWQLNFSQLSTPGWYRVRVAGVGVGHSFQVSSRVFDQVAAATQRGAYHARCGCALPSNLTRFSRGVCHKHDGTVMPTKPLPAWFAKQFNLSSEDMFPEVQRPAGTAVTAAHGHHDAGDYSKYTVSGSMFVAVTLLAYENASMAARLSRDDGQIPEAHNGVPDILDEIKWELDWLQSMQDPGDGGAYCIVKPNGTIDGWYQKGMPDESHNDDRVLLPKDTTCTGMLAGALATAAASPVMQKYYPTEVERWRTQAEHAWGFLQANANKPALCYQAYGCAVTTGPDSGCNKSAADLDMSHHTRVFAAIALYKASANQSYHEYVLDEHCPHYRHYNWEPLPTGENSGGGYTLATLSYALLKAAGTSRTLHVDTTMFDACMSELRYAAAFHLNSTTAAYGLMMPQQALNFRAYGWFFPQSIAWKLQLAVAANASPVSDAHIEHAITSTWDYLLGANPVGHSLITGFGSIRMRSVVDNDSANDKIDPPVPGIPVGLASGPSWMGSYGRGEGVIAPPFTSTKGADYEYPILAHQFDGWNVNREFTVQMLGFSMVTSAYFASTTAELGAAAANLPPVIMAVRVNTTYGRCPLTVRYEIDAHDPNPGGYLSKIAWNLESWPGTRWSQADAPTHTFTRPYTSNVAGVTVTSSLGKDTFFVVEAVDTTPGAYPFRSRPASIDGHTLAIMRPRTVSDGIVLRNPHQGNAPVAGVIDANTGAPKLSDKNLLWMSNRSGYAVTFAGANDTVTFILPSRFAQLASNGTLSVALKLFVRGSGTMGQPIGWGHRQPGNPYGNTMAGLVQNYNHGFGWSAGEWDRPPAGPSIRVYSPAKTNNVIVSASNLSVSMPEGAWYQLEFALTARSAEFYLNGRQIGRACQSTAVLTGSATVNLTFGGFNGYIDDVAVSNIVRAPPSSSPPCPARPPGPSPSPPTPTPTPPTPTPTPPTPPTPPAPPKPPPTPPSPSPPMTPTVVDAHTLAVLRAKALSDGLVLRDPHKGNAPVTDVVASTNGTPKLSDANLKWMAKPAGFALAVGNENDTLTFVLPAGRFSRLAHNATLSLALKLCVLGSGTPGQSIGWGHRQGGDPSGGNVLAGFVQDWEHWFAWFVGQWDRPPAGPRITVHAPSIKGPTDHHLDLVSSSALAQAMPYGVWYQLEFVLTPSSSSFYVDGKRVGETALAIGVIDGRRTMNLTLGGFEGFIDDVAISTVARHPE
jgi:hypothetical protein